MTHHTMDISADSNTCKILLNNTGNLLESKIPSGNTGKLLEFNCSSKLLYNRSMIDK